MLGNRPRGLSFGVPLSAANLLPGEAGGPLQPLAPTALLSSVPDFRETPFALFRNRSSPFLPRSLETPYALRARRASFLVGQRCDLSSFLPPLRVTRVNAGPRLLIPNSEDAPAVRRFHNIDNNSIISIGFGGRGEISPDRRKHSVISARVANLGSYCTAVLFEVLPTVANREGRSLSEVKFDSGASSKPTVPPDDSETAAGTVSRRRD